MQGKRNTMIKRIVDVCMTRPLILSVHYSGGSSLSDDIQKWLDVNVINK